MKYSYHISLEDLELEEYEKILESKRLLPGRKVLKERIHDNFNIIRSKGVNNLKELLELLKTKKKMEKFASDTGLSYNYLIILKRDIKSYQPNPINLKNFPGINPHYVEKMALIKIKNSKQLLIKVQNMEDLFELSEQLSIPLKELLEILKLSDLVRISGVGPVFARMLYDSGIDSTAKMAYASAEILFNELTALNKEKNYTRAKFTVKDVHYCIDFAKKLPERFEFNI
jgi:hypothetical protein